MGALKNKDTLFNLINNNNAIYLGKIPKESLVEVTAKKFPEDVIEKIGRVLTTDTETVFKNNLAVYEDYDIVLIPRKENNNG